MGCSASDALLELGVSAGIHVVVYKDPTAKSFCQPRAEWKMVKVQMGRLNDNTGPPVERARRTYSDCIQLARADTRPLQRFRAGLHNPLQDRFGAELGLGLVASAADQVACLVQDCGIYLRASKIQTQYESIHAASHAALDRPTPHPGW